MLNYNVDIEKNTFEMHFKDTIKNSLIFKLGFPLNVSLFLSLFSLVHDSIVKPIQRISTSRNSIRCHLLAFNWLRMIQ